MKLERFVSLQIRLFGYDEFMLLCQLVFAGSIMYGVGVFRLHHSEDLVIR